MDNVYKKWNSKTKFEPLKFCQTLPRIYIYIYIHIGRYLIYYLAKICPVDIFRYPVDGNAGNERDVNKHGFAGRYYAEEFIRFALKLIIPKK